MKALSRRSMLVASAATLTGAAVPLPVLASSSRDAALIELVRLLRESETRLDRLYTLENEAVDRYLAIAPDRPEETRRRGSDFCHFYGFAHRPGEDFYGAADMDYLRSFPPAPAPFRVKVNAAAKARADEIVAAWDRWQADQEAARAASGLVDAEEAVQAEADTNTALRLQVIATQAHTLEGLTLKAAFFVACSYDAPEDIEGALEKDFAKHGLQMMPLRSRSCATLPA
jgi:hypothetical protein